VETLHLPDDLASADAGPEGRCRLGDDFWDEILGNPPIVVFTARA
jgi:hypothetical protein